jgi:hypothetical protein
MAVYITRPRLVNVNIQMFQHPKIEEKNKGMKNKQNNSVKVNTTLQGSNGARGSACSQIGLAISCSHKNTFIISIYNF